MKLPLIIRSCYFKALLVLLKRDRVIDPHEREIMLQLGSVLDFDKRFCEAAINDLLLNPHITRESVVFMDENIKECFFRDAFRIALIDGELHQAELSWLRKVACSNGKTDQWFDSIVKEHREKRICSDKAIPFEIQRHL